jgi:Protein of unknown function (DUF3999)
MITPTTKLLALVLLGASSSIAYFKYQRPVQVSGSGQRYVVVDDTIWSHSRPDLGDLRLYAGQTEVPYALLTEHGSQQHEHKEVSVFQQSMAGGKTQFLVDMSAVAEYDHVDLRLGAKDFVAHFRVEGQDDLHAPQWALLGDSILYDLSREHLGNSFMLRLPRSTYKYLRVTVDGPVKPTDILGAISELHEDRNPVWRNVSNAPAVKQQGKDTVLSFTISENVPVEKVVFAIEASQPNFRRSVEIRDDRDVVLSTGEINRIHMVRAGQRIDSEDDEADFSEIGQKSLKIVIHNGDDEPLKLTSASLQQIERRIYFDAPEPGRLTLYYGDEKLERPEYDYAKLFLNSKDASAAQLGSEVENAAYTGRPDDRPWSERHPAILWIAIVAAVLVLGALALRSMRAVVA